MSDDFVTPDSTSLTLSGGQTVDIFTRLNHGQTEDLFGAISPYGVGMNRRVVRTAKILAYVIGWSLTKDGKPVPMGPPEGEIPEQTRMDTVRAMDPDLAVELHKAIEAHEAAMDKARAAQKKTRAGTPVATATSSSPSAPAGASSGSAPLTSTTTTDSSPC